MARFRTIGRQTLAGGPRLGGCRVTVSSDTTTCTNRIGWARAYETGAAGVTALPGTAKSVANPAQTGQPYCASEGGGIAGRSDAAIR